MTADVASLPAKWRDDAAAYRPEFGVMLEACANELEAALAPAGEGGLPDAVIAFLLGEGVLDGRGFGDEPPAGRGPYWWRKQLREAASALRAGADPVRKDRRFCSPTWQSAPRMVWLQVDAGSTDYSQPFPGEGVSWCWESIGGTEVEYVRADLAQPATPASGESFDKAAALEHFSDYFRRNYPGPDTIIGRPDWHAPKIFNAACYAIRAATPPASKGGE